MIGSVLNERYEIIDVIGEGGMATVYRAVDLILSREVALKVIHSHLARNSEFVKRFQQEAAIAAKLEHFNIVKIYDFGLHDDGRAYIVFELIRGKNFHELETEQFQKNRTAYEPIVSAMICEEILKGLACAHEHNCVHRDVKPDNVMITTDGNVKLTDFGIAKSSASTLTVVGKFLGSPSYSSPEQVQGKAVDFRSDIYSAGIILYEAVSGRLPFDGENVADVMMRIAKGEYRPLNVIMPDVPSALNEIVERALRNNPTERFSSADQFAGALRKFLVRYGIEDSRVGLGEYFANAQQFMRAHPRPPEQNQRNTIDVKIVDARTRESARLPTIEKRQPPEPVRIQPAVVPEARRVQETVPQVPARDQQPRPQQQPRQQRRVPRPILSIPGTSRHGGAAQNQSSIGFILSLLAFGVAVMLVIFLVVSSRDRSGSSQSTANAPQQPRTAPAAVAEAPQPQIPAPRRAEVAVSPPVPVQAPRVAPARSSVEPQQPRQAATRRQPIRARVARKPDQPPARVAQSAPAPVAEASAPVQAAQPAPPPAAPAPKAAPVRPAPVARPEIGRIVVQSIPAGVSVYIDGAFVGETPRSGQPKTVDLRPGQHSIKLGGGEIAGTRYESFEKTVFVESGRSVALGAVRLVPFRVLTIRITGPGVIVKVNNDPYSLSGKPLVLNLPEGRVNIEATAQNGKTLRKSIELRGEDFTLNSALE